MTMPILTVKDICAVCGKTPQMALNRPHSLQKTKKVVRPNLAPFSGLVICARCRKTIDKPIRVRKVQPKVATTETIEATA